MKIIYPCEKYTEPFLNKDKLKEHKKNKHTGISDDLKCTDCSFTDKTEEKLLKPMEYCHPAIFSPHKVKIPSTNLRQMKCFKCDHLKNTEGNLINHVETKHIQRTVIKPTTEKQMNTSRSKNPP